MVSIALGTGSAYGRDWDFLANDDEFRDLFMAELYSEVAADMLQSDAALPATKPPLPTTDLELPVEELTGDEAEAEPAWSKSVKPRIPEHENKIVPDGYQLVSGGAGEGKQHLTPEGSVSNKLEVKSDEELPSYCNPPNPCPKGKTAADGCQEGIQDTAEFNRLYILREMRDGRCTCDYEHMYPESCPTNQEVPEVAGNNFDDYMNGIFNEDNTSDLKNPYMSVGEKRKSLTAKKGGPPHSIYKRSNEEHELKNPYLQGFRLPVVAKKSPPML